MNQPFFVVGMGRSGSSYLRKLLNRHPRVALTNESHIIDVLSGVLQVYQLPVGERDEYLGITGVINPDYEPVITRLFNKHIPLFLETFYKECFPGKQFTHWGEKLPSLTAVSHFVEFYPHTRFVMLVRDPRDVVCSYAGFRTQRYGDDPSKASLFTPEFQTKRWVEVYSGLLDRLEDYHLVKYETLIADPETTVRGVLDHLGLEPVPEVFEDIAMPDFHAAQRTASETTGTIGRWRTELGTEDVAMVQSRCGELMKRFGYEVE